MARSLIPTIERILHRVEVVSNEEVGDCYLFTGGGGTGTRIGHDTGDHAKIKDNGRLRYVHRVSYEFFHGPIPPGLVVRHRCHRRRCVAPWHLIAGTHKQNTQDMLDAGRAVMYQRKPIDYDYQPDEECPF